VVTRVGSQQLDAEALEPALAGSLERR